ncbi:tyrosine-type recombinase/integrase [Paenibacillus sp. HJL G12]|uniref:Tyrosine-type recombinase/integrase n=1 Tax=Paenibacillus dendrobii TaxID=2691084 RepID=A0A7X3IKE3_9BACL|nr:site-specific integrase [Paenibacillus dendrobii]MWV44986.1 tyrosine-type recombinase/integrase [Paenibacillus dendrobii]
MPVYKDKNAKLNPWYYAFEVKDDNGKRKTIKKRGFKTKREAEILEVEARNEWNKGSYYEPIKSTFGEYIYQWIDNKQNLSEQARYNNLNHIKHHIIPLIGHVPMSKLNVFILEKFVSDLQDRNLAESTIRKIYNIVNTSLNAAAKKELLPKNPMTLLESAPRVSKKKLDYWTVDEVKQFLNGFEHRQKIVFQLAIYTGMRMGEILGLSISDIDLVNKRIHVRQVLTYDAKLKAGAKTISGNRSIAIPESLLNPLLEQIRSMEIEIEQYGEEYNKDRLLVCTTTGKPLTKPNLTSTWYYLLGLTKVRKIRFHDLRHTCASLLLQLGQHPKVVQELLGHSSIKVTIDLYSHMTPNMQTDAVNALDNLLK